MCYCGNAQGKSGAVLISSHITSAPQNFFCAQEEEKEMEGYGGRGEGGKGEDVEK